MENLLASRSEEGPDLRCTSVMYATGGWTGMLRLTLFLVYPNLDTASLLNSKWSVINSTSILFFIKSLFSFIRFFLRER